MAWRAADESFCCCCYLVCLLLYFKGWRGGRQGRRGWLAADTHIQCIFKPPQYIYICDQKVSCCCIIFFFVKSTVKDIQPILLFIQLVVGFHIGPWCDCVAFKKLQIPTVSWPYKAFKSWRWESSVICVQTGCTLVNAHTSLSNKCIYL